MNGSSEEGWKAFAINLVSIDTSLQHLTTFCPACLLTFNSSFPRWIFSFVVYTTSNVPLPAYDRLRGAAPCWGDGMEWKGVLNGLSRNREKGELYLEGGCGLR